MNKTVSTIYTEYLTQCNDLTCRLNASRCASGRRYQILLYIQYIFNPLQWKVYTVFFFHKLPWCFGSNLTSQMKLKKGVKVSVREFKYIKSGTKTDHPCSHCIPAGACLSSPLIWQKDPNQALSLGLIVCDIHNTPLVNCYLHLDGEQVVLLKLWVLESLLSSQKNK